jgi:hypothetical protein
MRGLRVPETLDQHNWLVSNQSRIVELAQGPEDVT